MIFLSIVEIIIGVFGLGQLVIGLISLPFGVVYIFSALPLILLGAVGTICLKKNIESEKIKYISLCIFSVIIFTGSIVLPFRELQYFGPAFLTKVAGFLWPFFNTSAFLPPFLKIGILCLLILHFTILVFKKFNTTKKTFLVVWVFIIGMFLVNLGSFAINARGLSNILDIKYLNSQQLSDGIKVKDKFVYAPEEKRLGGLTGFDVSETYIFKVAKSPGLIFLSIGVASTEQEAKNLFKEEITNLIYLNNPDVVRKTIDVVGGEGFIVNSPSTIKKLSAFIQVHKIVITIDYNPKATESSLSADNFENFVKIIIKSVTY